MGTEFTTVMGLAGPPDRNIEREGCFGANERQTKGMVLKSFFSELLCEVDKWLELWETPSSWDQALQWQSLYPVPI